MHRSIDCSHSLKRVRSLSPIYSIISYVQSFHNPQHLCISYSSKSYNHLQLLPQRIQSPSVQSIQCCLGHGLHSQTFISLHFQSLPSLQSQSSKPAQSSASPHFSESAAPVSQSPEVASVTSVPVALVSRE